MRRLIVCGREMRTLTQLILFFSNFNSETGWNDDKDVCGDDFDLVLILDFNIPPSVPEGLNQIQITAYGIPQDTTYSDTFYVFMTAIWASAWDFLLKKSMYS